MERVVSSGEERSGHPLMLTLREDPVLDYLLEEFAEPGLRGIAKDVTRYILSAAGKEIRITPDKVGSRADVRRGGSRPTPKKICCTWRGWSGRGVTCTRRCGARASRGRPC